MAVFLMFIFSSLNSYSQQFDVRNTKWGMTTDEVIKSEGIAPNSNGIEKWSGMTFLNYETSIEQRKVLITFLFENNRLREVDYRYYWGTWQNNVNEHTFSDRVYSIENVFESLKAKNFKPYGEWRVSGDNYSENSRKFENCQNGLGPFTAVKEKIDKINQCCSIFARSTESVSIYLYFGNLNTTADVSFPLISFFNGKKDNLSDEILCWVKFRPSGKKSDF